jgi:PPOX class probable F420-dependent enzyme
MAQPDRFLALPESVRRFLAPPQYATISTVMPDGSPHQAVVWYALADDSLMVNSRRGRRWPANLERDPRVSIAVFDGENPERWVGVRGLAEVVRTGTPAVADIQDLARRYDGSPAAFVGQDRITFRIRPTSTFEQGDD